MTLRTAQKKVLLALLLGLLAATAYLPASRCGFVDYDDTDYVTENLKIQDGLTLPGVTWAFSTGHAANWHPLTWLSHMLDVQFYDLSPMGHHLTSLAFHAVNSALLFLLLMQFTGALWRSAFVAALFALHPTHVESVAWVSERKDVLSTFFALLSLWAYAKYAEKKARSTPHAWRFYLLALALFVLGLMSKPMLVTLPFLFLLLDFWPLGRLQSSLFKPKAVAPLLVEKTPFFLLAAISSVATFLVQHAGGATVSTTQFSLGGRVSNVLVSYVRYLGKLFWPDNLAVFYPRPAEWPWWQVGGSAAILVLITGFVLRFALTRGYLAVGWFWFLGTLVPVIGLVQVGEQAMADRYAYIPSIGIFIAVVWGIEEVVRPYKPLKLIVTAGAICALAAFFLGTWQQIRHWETTETLFRHAVLVTTDNPTAEEALASALSNAGKLDDAEHHSLNALRAKPDFPEAIITYAVVLARQGRLAEARAQLTDVLRRGSKDANVHFALAQAYASSGDIAQAIQQYQAGLRLKPENADALNNLAWIRAANADPTFRNGEDAVQLAQKACELTRYRRPIMLGTLAAAYAEAGRFPDAVAMAQKAHDLCLAKGQKELADKNQELLQSYEAGKPYHEAAQTNALPLPHS